jgi:imidazolonepropionase-like amidohydrolase
MTALGMSPAAALRTATSSAATLLGIDERVGSLEPGKLADIIAVPGNPLTDIHQTERVSFVMKEGVVTKAAAGR